MSTVNHWERRGRRGLILAVCCLMAWATGCGTDAVVWDTSKDAAIHDDTHSDVPDTHALPDAAPDTVQETVELPGDSLEETDVATDTHVPVWRSVLFPSDWTPLDTDDKGRFLHDFSYAGYQHGEAPPVGETMGILVDVVADYGVDSTGMTDSTAQVQQAIDDVSIGGGGVVFFPEGLYRFDGVLKVVMDGVVLRGAGAELSRLFFTSTEKMDYSSHITIGNQPVMGDDAPLLIDGIARDSVLVLKDASGLKVGDDVVVGWTISPEFIEEHGMTGTWKAFNDTWQPFFHRTITSVDTSSEPHTITLDVPIRYPAKVRDEASVRVVSGVISQCGVEELGLGNATGWAEAWNHKQIHALQLNGTRDSWVVGVESFSPPTADTEGYGAGKHLTSGGVLVRWSKRVTVADSSFGYAMHRGGGGNGYLFEIRQSSEILTRDSVGVAGRHNFIQNWGFGTTGCVWLRIHSAEGEAQLSPDLPFGPVGLSEFHHSLATANLIDQSVLDDGWAALNRKEYSTGAGQSAAENVFWNTSGVGVIRSFQHGWGYVIGTRPDVEVRTYMTAEAAEGSAPEDYTEGLGQGEGLEPASLYEAQRMLRLNP